jgi:hypothetical protein
MGSSVRVATDQKAGGSSPSERANVFPGQSPGGSFRSKEMHNGAVGLWRTWDQRLLWLGAVNVACTLWLIDFLLTGHHHLVVRVWAVLAWAVVVLGISAPAIAKIRRRQHR